MSKRDSLLPVQSLQDEAAATAILAITWCCLVYDGFTQWLDEFKPMTKYVSTSHNGTTSCPACRQCDFQPDCIPNVQFDRQNSSHAGFTHIQGPTRHQPTFRTNCHFGFQAKPPVTPVFPPVP